MVIKQGYIARFYLSRFGHNAFFVFFLCDNRSLIFFSSSFFDDFLKSFMRLFIFELCLEEQAQ